MIIIMRALWVLLTVVACVGLAGCRKIKKRVALNTLSQPLFVTKFGIGAGEGRIDIKYKIDRKQEINDASKLSLRLGLLTDTIYPNFRAANDCGEKEAMYSEYEKISVGGYERGSEAFIIAEQQEHIYYVYLYDCLSEVDWASLQGSLILDVEMKNNGSNMGADEEYFVLGYSLLIALWIGLLVAHFLPILKSVTRSDDITRLCVYAGFVILGLGYFYRFLDVLMAYYNGEGVDLLRIIYECIKHVVEGIIITILVSIAWGWSITHLQHQTYCLIMGAVAIILNVLATVFASFSQESQLEFHQFDNPRGTIIVSIRALICLMFLLGIVRSINASVGRVKYFLQKFAVWAGAYLLSLPTAILLAEFFLPNYLHREFITIIDEMVHLVTTAYMCRLFALPNNAYMKVNLKDEDAVLPDYVS